MNRLYTQDIIDYLKEISHHRYNKEITAMFNKKFNVDFTEKSIAACRYSHGIKNNIDATFKKGTRFSPSTEFKKGMVPANKGMKGVYAPGCEKTWFKKGHKPKNYLPVGTELMKSDGYVYTKIADPNKWKQSHRILWESVNGSYSTKTHALIFKDSDRTNITIENLELITRRQLAILNKNNLITKDKDLTETGLIIGQILEVKARRKKNEK
ncbi:MAG: HNH endonuclease signature motif containing protein [Acholeplasmataceae bacterium]